MSKKVNESEKKISVNSYLQKYKQPEYISILLKSSHKMEFKTVKEWDAHVYEIKNKKLN